MMFDTSETGIEGLGVGLEDLEDMTEDLAGDMGDLKSGAKDLEDLKDLETGTEDLGRTEDLEDGVDILATGSQDLEGVTGDLDDLGDKEVGTEELEAKGMEALADDLETGMEDLGKLEDWVWVDWFLFGRTSGSDLVAALLGELPVSLVSSSSPPSSSTTTPPADMGTEGVGQELGCLAGTW